MPAPAGFGPMSRRRRGGAPRGERPYVTGARGRLASVPVPRVMGHQRCGPQPHQRLSALRSLTLSFMQVREGETQGPSSDRAAIARWGGALIRRTPDLIRGEDGSLFDIVNPRPAWA